MHLQFFLVTVRWLFMALRFFLVTVRCDIAVPSDAYGIILVIYFARLTAVLDADLRLLLGLGRERSG